MAGCYEMSRDGGRCFLPGLQPPSSPSATALAPHPKMGETLSYPQPSGHPKRRSSAPGASGCDSWGPPIDRLGHRLPRSPPSLRGCAARCLLGGAGCPPCPVPQLCPPCSQEAAQSRVGSRCPPRCSPVNVCDGKDFHPLPISSSTLNFSVAQSVKQLFFPFIIQTPG